MKVYLDSCMVISLVAGTDELRRQILISHPSGNEIAPCASGIVRLECMVDVYRRNDEAMAARYFRYFQELDMLSVDDMACDLAARIRASSRLKLPDALHLAIAERNGCQLFWTADADFTSVLYPLNVKIHLSRH